MNQLKKYAIFKTAMNAKGFSLMEILIAVALLGIIGAVVGGKLFDLQREGQKNSTIVQMQALSDQLKQFKRHCFQYPTTDQGLEALVSKPTTGKECKRYAPNGYLDGSVPKDAWDSDFIYSSDGKTFTIQSVGDDQTEGTEDDIFYPTDNKGGQAGGGNGGNGGSGASEEPAADNGGDNAGGGE